MKNVDPQNSLSTASTHANFVEDFRSRAVAASEIMRRSSSGGLSPGLNVSYCLPRQPSLSRYRTPIKIAAVACAALGLSGMAASAVILFLGKGSKFGDENNVPVIAACCCFGAMLSLVFPVFFERWIVRKYLPEREEEYGVQNEGVHIALEYAPTYGSLKILAEDVGLIYIHAADHYVKICGLSYDYVIQSRNVVGLSLHPNRKTVLLSYMVGDERLDLAILPRSLLAEFKRQTLGASKNLFVRIQETLGAQH